MTNQNNQSQVFSWQDKNETVTDSSIIFISDLHLTTQAPDILLNFRTFIDSLKCTSRVYILGDLFEYWLGDDASEMLGHQQAEKVIQKLSEKGTKVYFIPGNRDFLVGKNFAFRTGAKILDDPTIHEFFGIKFLLLHGDTLCTDDKQHQQFRNMVNSSEWQSTFLRKSISQRDMLAQSIRFRSDENKRYKSSAIMDVNQNTVNSLFKSANVNFMIHGHTHRPAIHHWVINKKQVYRIVLGDWSNGPSWLKVSQSNISLHHNESSESISYDGT